MNDATLERLMMDAAVGGLNEDVRELLTAHLDDQKRRELAELQEVTARAREVLGQECPAEPDLRDARRRWRIDRAMTWGGRIMAMAASLLIGFGVAGLRPVKQVEVVVREKPADPPVVAVNDARPVAEGELWSAQRIYKNAMEVNRNEKPRVGPKRIFQ